MGTLRYATDDDGHSVELSDHEGYVAKLLDDGTDTSGGLVAEIDQRTVAHRAACSCGWRGATTVPREPGRSAWPEWEDVPALDAEWEAHTDPLLDALAHPGPAPARRPL
jgi:hypothetical protein